MRVSPASMVGVHSVSVTESQVHLPDEEMNEATSSPHTTMEGGAASGASFGMRGHLRVPSSAQRDLLCIVLHGHGMRAQQMVEWFEEDLCPKLPSVEFLFLQAPVSWQISSQDFLPSWLKYLKEYDGEREDDLCEERLRQATADLRSIIEREASAVGGTRGTALLGLSEGGCMALEVACLVPLAGVITLVSHRLRYSSDTKLLCPWFALTASRDDIYRSNWALEHLRRGDAHKWKIVDDDHYLQHSDGETDAFAFDAFAEIRARVCAAFMNTKAASQ